MTEADVLLAKISHIQDCIARIHSKVNNNIDNLDDLDVEEIVVFNLQRAIQSTIDIAFHIVSTEKLGLPQNLKEAFKILASADIIGKALAEKLMKMVGFRNIVVHEYEDINVEVLKNVVIYHLKDLEEFYSHIKIRYVG